MNVKSRDSIKSVVEHDTARKPNVYGTRHTQAILMFFGMTFGYFLRVNISAAIVPMTQTTSNRTHYDWDPSTKSLILSSFFWGYVLAQIPAGLLARRYGAKIVLSLATAIGATLTIFHPLAAAHGGWELLCTLRVFVGLAQGVVYPCIHTLLAKWVPRTERGFLTTSVYSGAQFGTVLILATSGVIFDSSMGWQGIFYISGGIAIVWAIIFMICGADEPEKSKHITKAERDYIESLTGSASGGEALAVPWKSLFTSLPFYGLIAAHCGFTWGFYTLLMEIPTYMSNVLNLNVKSNALLSALPYLAMWVMCFVVSPISDMLINRRILSVTASRKLFNSIGQWIPMVCLIALAFMTEDEKLLAIILLVFGVGFNAASFCGYLVNHMDLSPNFAGPMMGITNGVSNLMSIFAPLVVGAIVTDEEDPTQWRIVFFITAGVYLLCNAFFVVFGSSEVQPWNDQTLTQSNAVLPNNVELNSNTTIPTIFRTDNKDTNHSDIA